MKGLRQKVRDMKRGLAPPSTDLSGARVTLVEPPFILPHNFIDYPLFMNLGLLHNAALLERMGAEVFDKAKNRDTSVVCGIMGSYCEVHQGHVINGDLALNILRSQSCRG